MMVPQFYGANIHLEINLRVEAAKANEDIENGLK